MAINDDIYNALIAAGLPVDSVTANNEAKWQNIAITLAQMQQAADIVLQHTDPTEYNARLQYRADVQTVIDTFQDTITRQEQIRDAGAVPFTQTGFNQLVQAVKDLALFQERHYKFDARRVQGGTGAAARDQM